MSQLNGDPDGPLRGLRVLDIGTTIAAPLAATLMADFGADVIKIEHPRLGDAMRHWDPFKGDTSLWWKVIGRNKRSITVDLSRTEGKEIFLALVADADVVIENFRPGTLERWGLGYPELQRANPGVIVVRISGYGQDGPLAQQPGYGTIAEAMTGVPSFTGFPDNPPTLAAFPLADSVAAMFACFSAMFAVYEREQSSEQEGQVIDVSLFEPLFRIVESQVVAFDQLEQIKQRMGNRIAEEAPRNSYRTKDDGWIAISCSTDRTFHRLARAIEREDLIDDPRFASNSTRVANAEVLDEIVADWFRTQTTSGAMALLESADVVAGPMLTIDQILEHPQYVARNTVTTVEDEEIGPIRMQNVVPRFSRTPGRVRFAGPQKGEHTEEILNGELGMDTDRIERLREDGVV